MLSIDQTATHVPRRLARRSHAAEGSRRHRLRHRPRHGARHLARLRARGRRRGAGGARRRRSSRRSPRRCARAAGARCACRPTSPRPTTASGSSTPRRREFGRIDVLVNNAFKGGLEPPMAEADLDEWRKIFDVNVFGSLQLTQAVIPHMQRAAAAARSSSSTRCRCASSSRSSAATPPRRARCMIAAQTLAQGARPRQHPRQLASCPATSGARRWRATSRCWRSSRAPRPTTVYAEIAVAHGAATTSRPRRRSPTRSSSSPPTCRAPITGQALDVNGGHFFH